VAEPDGWGESLNLSVSEVIGISKRFLVEEGFDNVRIISAVAIEGEAEWKITAEIGQPVRDKKEIIINDRDGQIISYKTA
jgi:hypothetical protein